MIFTNQLNKVKYYILQMTQISYTQLKVFEKRSQQT